MHRCRIATSTHSGWRRTNLVVFISCISKKILPTMTRSHVVNVKFPFYAIPMCTLLHRDSVSSSPFSGVCSYLILPWREVCRGRSTGHSCDVRINWWSLSLRIEESSHAYHTSRQLLDLQCFQLELKRRINFGLEVDTKKVTENKQVRIKLQHRSHAHGKKARFESNNACAKVLNDS